MEPSNESLASAADGDKHGISFLHIPTEMRNEIYKDVLIQEEVINIKELPPYIAEPGVLFASKQIRSEALPIFYGANRFQSPGIKVLHQLFQTYNTETLALFRTLLAVATTDDRVFMNELASVKVLVDHEKDAQVRTIKEHFFDRLQSKVYNLGEELLSQAHQVGLSSKAMFLPLIGSGERPVNRTTWVCIEDYKEYRAKEQYDGQIVFVKVTDDM